jgi:hypothetical protein
LRRSDLDPETDVFASQTLKFETTNEDLWATTEEEYTDPEASYTTGTLHKPLQRRAPYMYEDDPIRKRFSQQLDRPRVRRRTAHLQDNH